MQRQRDVSSASCLKVWERESRVIAEEVNVQGSTRMICQGSFLFIGFGHPNKKDIQEAVDFAIGLSGKVRE